MHKLAALALVAATGCGTLFNGGPASVNLPPGATVDGQSGTVSLDKKTSHVVEYPDGNRCTIQSGVSAGYLILDIFATGLIGILVDGITGDWKVLKGDCPGVTEN